MRDQTEEKSLNKKRKGKRETEEVRAKNRARDDGGWMVQEGGWATRGIAGESFFGEEAEERREA